MTLDHEATIKLLHISADQAVIAEKQGDIENANAIKENIKRLGYAIVEDEIKKNPELLELLYLEAMTHSEKQEMQRDLLKYLEDKGY